MRDNERDTLKSGLCGMGHIAVVGPGIVGMPMAALLAKAFMSKTDEERCRVTVIQRNSPTSGWKVGAINAGRSPIGGKEPALAGIIAEVSEKGLLKASHDFSELARADVILVCVQTDKKGMAPDYGPLWEALTDIAEALRSKPSGKQPLLIFESTLAPSTMATVIRPFFSKLGLEEGRDILLGNSPNRVMPGFLVERVAGADKIVAGLSPGTPERIESVYRHIVTEGRLFKTNSLTAEVVKTLENAYRDVRIAFAAEIVRFCDQLDVDFYQVRDAVNTRLLQADYASRRPNAVPVGGVLVPSIGVGGHCLPKDGILLWWRLIETLDQAPESIILEARLINDESPAHVISLLRRRFGDICGKSVALFGAAYRFNSEDTRNSPSFSLAGKLLDRGCRVTIHDPYVKPDDQNLVKQRLDSLFTRDYAKALTGVDYVIFCVAHQVYQDEVRDIHRMGSHIRGMLDGCNLFPGKNMPGVGRGSQQPPRGFIDFVYDSFRVLETGFANEVLELLTFLNDTCADDDFNHISFEQVRALAASCTTGCAIASPGEISGSPVFRDFVPRLVRVAAEKKMKG